MTTILQACKQIVKDSIDPEMVQEYGSLSAMYNREYGKHNGLSTKACRDYLQGLPSVCTVPFSIMARFLNCWQNMVLLAKVNQHKLN